MSSIEFFIPQIAGRVRNYKKVRGLYKFSCPYCGDSHKDRLKARGYLYERHGVYFFHCHNCQYHASAQKFLKEQFPDIYSEFLLSKFQKRKCAEVSAVDTPAKNGTLDLLILPITNDRSADFGRAYLAKRQIPESQWHRLYYIDDLRKLSCLKEEYLEKIKFAERSILLPHWTRTKRLFAINARNIEPDAHRRYMLMRVGRDEHETIFGLDCHDVNRKTYVVEGCFDSLFLPNSIACNTSDLTRATPFVDVARSIFIPDNQYRNREVVALMKKAASQNLPLLVWPKTVKSKDINDVVLSKEVSDLEGMIAENTFRGPRLMLELAKRIEI